MDATSYLLGKKSGGGPTPTGTINITTNGTKDVTNYASANVNVQPDLETKSVTITENTTTTITPTTGKDGMSSVVVTTNVSGGSIETLDDLNACVHQYINVLNNIPNNYDTYTTNNVTLYTPSSDNKYYTIYKDKNNKYRIMWSTSIYQGDGLQLNKTSYYYLICSRLSYASGDFYYSTLTVRYYSTNTYDTIEDCITAIQSNQTAYTRSTTSSDYQLYDKNSILMSNSYIVDKENDNEFIIVQRISSNETIQVI